MFLPNVFLLGADIATSSVDGPKRPDGFALREGGELENGHNESCNRSDVGSVGMKKNHFTHKVGQSTTHLGLSAPHSQALVTLLAQFERAWGTSARLSIHQMLEQPTQVPRSVLLESLLLTEWSLKQKHGDVWTFEEYASRFPDDAAVLDKARRAIETESDVSSVQPSIESLSQDASRPKQPEQAKQKGRFMDVQQLGSGGMGMVFTAFDPERNTKVALKTIKHVGGEAIYRFKREFRALADIVHPNLCPLYELLMIDGVWFITMPFVDGLDLVRYTRKDAQPHPSHMRSIQTRNVSSEIDSSWNQSTVGGESSSTSFGDADDDLDFEIDAPSCRAMVEFCNERVVRDVFAQIARGLGALHQAGRLHRDLKPANVLVDRTGQVFILDFGLVAEGFQLPVREVSASSSPAADLSLDSNVELPTGLESGPAANREDPDRTEVHEPQQDGPRFSGSIEGTPHYMAPEQAMGLADLGPACDWYAFGVMLFQVLTGTLPFSGPGVYVIEQKKWQDAPRPQELVHGIPTDLAELCIGLLQRDPNQRPGVGEILRVLTGDEATPSPPASLDPRMPFVGRERLFAALAEVTRGVRDGRPAIVRMHGRSGAGKSSIVQRFLDSLRSPKDLVLKGRCYEQESVPYKALDGIMDSLSTALSHMSPANRKKYLSTNAAELARVFEVLQRIPELASAAEQLPVSEPGELRRRAMAGLRALLNRLSEEYSVTLAIDDFQWGDAESATILLDLYCSPSPPKSLLLVSYRDEYESTSECLRKWLNAEAGVAATTEIFDMPIGPLTDAESTSLVSELLPADLEHRDAYSAIIVRESAGNPFFVIELALAASQGRKLPMQVGDEKQRILDEVLWSRIQELPEDVQRMLEVVAVAGQPTTMDVIYEAAGFAIRDPQILSRLRIERLVRSSGPSLESELEAYHDRIRETMVAHLPASSKVRHHHALARSLEHKGGADAETLAHHFFNAEVPEKAGLYLELAADKASESLAFDHAAGLYRQALAVWPQGAAEECSLRTRLGTALANAGRGEQAAIEFAAAATGADADEKPDLQRKSAYQYCISGHVEKGKAAIGELLDSVGLAMPESTFATIGSLLWHRTLLYWRGLGVTLRPESSVPKKLLQQVDLAWSAAAGMSMFELISGCRLSTLTLRLALDAGEPRRLVRALCWEAVQRINAGGSEIATGERMIAMAERIAGGLDDPYSATMIPFAQGIGEFMQGNWSRAIQVLDDASTQFAKTCLNVHWELGTARLFVLYSMYWNGDLSEYQRRADALHAAAVSCGDFYAELSLGTFDLPFSRLVADQPAEASQLIETYMDRLQLGRYSLQDMYAFMQKTNLYIYTDRPQQAWSLIQAGWTDLQQSMLMLGEHIRMACWEIRARSAIACVDHSLEDGSPRKEALRAIGKIEKEQLLRFAPLPLLFRAGLAAAEGDPVAAQRWLRQGIEQAEKCSLGIYLQPARWQLGRLLNDEEGNQLVASAEAKMQSEGIKNPARFASMLVPGFSGGHARRAWR